ncbi:MAG: YbgC/FadM family acyl-CoA thioesterase [Alphaproteobacteria bacterium]
MPGLVATPSSGAIVGHVHIFAVRIYFEDTDAGGIVYYANYLKFAERARTEMMRIMGLVHSEVMTNEGWGFTVRDCTVAYLAPARLDDVIEVHSRVIGVTGATISLGQTVCRNGTDLARITVRLAGRRVGGRPARLPPQLRAKLMILATASADQTA